MSLRALRRSGIAAAAIGGTLALASSASAIQIPMGTPSSSYYEAGGPTTVYGLLNQAYAGLGQADQLLVELGDTAVPQSYPPETGTGALTAAQAQQIAADFTNTTINGTAPSASGFAAELSVADHSYASDAANVASAGTGWSQLSSLIGSLGSVTSPLYSVDSTGTSITSSGTVVSTSDPIAYNITVSAPSGGYILPSAFTLTFPSGLSVNTGLVSDEVNAAANGTTATDIAAVEAAPPSSATSIGTATLASPLADDFGGSSGQLTGKVYVVTTGATSGQGSATQPYLELWFGTGIYELGSFPSSLSFPLTLQFGEATTPLGSEPIPLSSLAISFPAATSPVKTSSCTTLGTVTGTATDAVANLALLFGDANDGLTSATGTPAAVNVASTATAVTDQCATTSSTPKTKNTVSTSARGLTSGHPTFTFKIKANKAFKTITISLPKGLSFVKAKKLIKEISGAKIKSVRIAHGKLVITLKKTVKSETIKTKKGLIKESSALIKSIKKHKTKKLTVHIKAGSANIKSTFKA